VEVVPPIGGEIFLDDRPRRCARFYEPVFGAPDAPGWQSNVIHRTNGA
jgi:hypothetical protein